LLNDCAAEVAIGQCAGRFQRGLAEGIARACQELALQQGCQRVLLSGGCFQNRLLLEGTVTALRQRGLEPLWPEAVPCNDGGLALGQVAAARRALSITKPATMPLGA
jgi:hydrogenase maturation protein HypF